MVSLDKTMARRIIDNIGSSGQPPEFGVQYFTVGLEPYLDVIDEEYLSTFIKDGGSAFKLVVGIYGGGKTHFLYNVRDKAWSQNYAVSYVSLRSSGESPFHRLELVYKAIVNGLLPPLEATDRNLNDLKGIPTFLQTWYGQRYALYAEQGFSEDVIRQRMSEEIKDIDVVNSMSFKNAITGALAALLNNQDTAFNEICQWLQGEGFERKKHSRYGIMQKIDKTTAFTMIRSLGQVIRQMDYSGLIILLDEAERVPSLTSRQREQHLSNLRELIDECTQSAFQGMLAFYAVPDDNFLDGRTLVYEALRQRLDTAFDDFNPTGVRIELEKLVDDPDIFLQNVGNKILPIYKTAYEVDLPADGTSSLVENIAHWAYGQRFSDDGYKRLFVQKLVRGLNYYRVRQAVPDLADLE